MRILICFLPKRREKTLEMVRPMMMKWRRVDELKKEKKKVSQIARSSKREREGEKSSHL